MKISPKLAAFVASYRFKYLNELALYRGTSVHFAINRAVDLWVINAKKGVVIEGVEIPDSHSGLTEKKAGMIAEGKHSCRAYLAQIALHECLAEGYEPVDSDDLRLTACMLLVRSHVKVLDDAIKLMPSGWQTNTQQRFIEMLQEISRDA